MLLLRLGWHTLIYIYRDGRHCEIIVVCTVYYYYLAIRLECYSAAALVRQVTLTKDKVHTLILLKLIYVRIWSKSGWVYEGGDLFILMYIILKADLN